MIVFMLDIMITMDICDHSIPRDELFISINYSFLGVLNHTANCAYKKGLKKFSL